MSINSRRKGAGGEREFAQELESLTGVPCVRNLTQTRDGGHDLDVNGYESEIAASLARFSIEVKRYKAFNGSILSDAIQQSVKCAKERDRIPLVAFRGNSKKWAVMIPLAAIAKDLPHSEEWVRLGLGAFVQVLEGLK